MDTLLVCYFFGQVPCSMPQLKGTSPVLEPCISNKVSPILFRTVFACSVSFMASSAHRVLPQLAVCQLQMTLCWSSGSLEICSSLITYVLGSMHSGVFWISSVSGIHSPLADRFLSLSSLGLRTLQWTPLQTPRASVSPSKLQIHSARAAPFILAKASIPQCAVHALPTYLVIRGYGPGPLFLCQSGQPLLSALLANWLRRIYGLGWNFRSFF